MFGANVEIEGTDATLGGPAGREALTALTALAAMTGMIDAADSIRPTTLGRLAGSADWLESVGLDDNGDGRINSTSRGI